jgi:toxin ParE1/3/4
MHVVYHPLAEAELVEAARYYEERAPALGGQFLDAVNAGVREIRQAPGRWQLVEGNVRRYMLSRFPFAIYFSVQPGQVRILAVKHHRRHPDYWHSRKEN